MQSNRRSFIRQSALLSLGGISNSASTDFSMYDNIQLKHHSIFLFQGDSITDGNRGRNADLNHIMGHGYAYSIASRIGVDFPASNFQFFNRGISGNTVLDLEKRWKEDTLDLHPDVFSLLVGINDVNAAVNQFTGSQMMEEFKLSYRHLLQQVKDQNPETLMVLGFPFVAAGSRTNAKFKLFEQLVQEKNDFIKKIATEFDALVVDYPSLFEQAYKKQSIEYWIWDGVHPTVFGHELMAREWIKVVSKRLTFLKHYKY